MPEKKIPNYKETKFIMTFIGLNLLALVITLILWTLLNNYNNKMHEKHVNTYQLVHLTPHHRNEIDSIFSDNKYYTISYQQKGTIKHTEINDSDLIQDVATKKAKNIKLTTNGYHNVTKAILIK